MDAFAYGLASADQPGLESMDAIWDRDQVSVGIQPKTNSNSSIYRWIEKVFAIPGTMSPKFPGYSCVAFRSGPPASSSFQIIETAGVCSREFSIMCLGKRNLGPLHIFDVLWTCMCKPSWSWCPKTSWRVSAGAASVMWVVFGACPTKEHFQRFAPQMQSTNDGNWATSTHFKWTVMLCTKQPSDWYAQ